MCAAFSQYQPIYAEHGIATIPCDLQKRPLVRQPQKFGVDASAKIAIRFPDAQAFGYYAGARNGISVLDVDTANENILAAAIDRHGSSPIIVRTGSGKFHALYRHNGERRSIRPWTDLPIDVLGSGLCIAPPSTVVKGQYQIIEGSLDDLDRLPIMRKLEDRLYTDRSSGPATAWQTGRPWEAAMGEMTSSGGDSMQEAHRVRRLRAAAGSCACAQRKLWRTHGRH